MPTADGPVEKLSIVVFSGAYDRVHYALAMAAAALAANRPATLLFTMGAIRGLLAADADGPGWRHLAPTEEGRAPQAADEALRNGGLATFEELIGALAALGGTVMVCEMGLTAIGCAPGDLRADLSITPGGLTSFLRDASRHGALVFV